MARYIALIDGKAGAYREKLHRNADVAEAIAHGGTLASAPLEAS
jgi:hypothetical protein